MLPPLEKAKACPFCRCELTPDTARNTGYSHPSGGDCILAGWFIGAANVTLWNKRRAVIRYNVVEGELVFSKTGAKPATNEFLNQMVEYYRSQMK